MIKTEKLENKKFLEQSITYLKKSGYKNIKADIVGYDTPKTFVKKGSDIKVTPDITAEKAGRKHYIEISLKSEKTNLLKTKWRLLDVLSRLKDDRFKIITTRGHFQFTNRMLNDLNLEKNLIKL